MIPRLSLPELEDQPWLPAWIRDAMTGYLQTVIEQLRPYAAATPALAELLRDTGSVEVLDLGSGAGGPWRGLVAELTARGVPVRVTLSDIIPNLDAVAPMASAGVTYLERSVSALEVPPELSGARTMFTALHHFSPAELRAIFAAAQRDRVGFAAFEATERSWRGLVITLFIPILVLFLMPRVRPRRIGPLVLTYLPPLLPLLIWWDGFASTLKSYRPEELRRLTAEITEPGYSWEISEIPVGGGPIPLLQVIGRPVPNAGGSR